MKAAKKNVAAAILLAIVVLVSMAVNVYNAYNYNISANDRSGISEGAFFGWWAVSFIAAFLLYAVSQNMYRDNKKDRVFANWVTGVITVLAVSMAIF